MNTYRRLLPLALVLALAACATPPLAPGTPEAAIEPVTTAEKTAVIDIEWPAVAAFLAQATAGNGTQIEGADAAGIRLRIPDAEGFESGGTRITAPLAKTLDGVAKTLDTYPALHARIVGHTDSIGREGYNMALSRERALAVAAYLTNTSGVPTARLHAEGAGEREPAADNDTPEGRQANRRVEILLFLPE